MPSLTAGSSACESRHLTKACWGSKSLQAQASTVAITQRSLWCQRQKNLEIDWWFPRNKSATQEYILIRERTWLDICRTDSRIPCRWASGWCLGLQGLGLSWRCPYCWAWWWPCLPWFPVVTFVTLVLAEMGWERMLCVTAGTHQLKGHPFRVMSANWYLTKQKEGNFCLRFPTSQSD